jgi:hypothetical protein
LKAYASAVVLVGGGGGVGVVVAGDDHERCPRVVVAGDVAASPPLLLLLLERLEEVDLGAHVALEVAGVEHASAAGPCTPPGSASPAPRLQAATKQTEYNKIN